MQQDPFGGNKPKKSVDPSHDLNWLQNDDPFAQPKAKPAPKPAPKPQPAPQPAPQPVPKPQTNIPKPITQEHENTKHIAANLSLDDLHQLLLPYQQKIEHLQNQNTQQQMLLQQVVSHVKKQNQEVKESFIKEMVQQKQEIAQETARENQKLQVQINQNKQSDKQKEINVGLLNELTKQHKILLQLDKKLNEQSQSIELKQRDIEQKQLAFEQKQLAFEQKQLEQIQHIQTIQMHQLSEDIPADFHESYLKKPSLWQKITSFFSTSKSSQDIFSNQREKIDWNYEPNPINQPRQTSQGMSQGQAQSAPMPRREVEVPTHEMDSQEEQLIRYKNTPKDEVIEERNEANRLERPMIASIKPNGPSSDEYQVGGITLNKGDFNSNALYPVIMQQSKTLKKQEQGLRELAEAIFKIKELSSKQEESIKKMTQSLVKEFDELKKQVEKIQKTKDQSKALQDGLEHQDQRIAQLELQLEGLGSKLAEFDQKMSSKDPSKQATDIRVSKDPELGDYTSIADAILAAPVGAYIGILPGVYEEPLEIQKPVKLIGLGKPQEIVIQVRGQSCIVLQKAGGIYQESLSDEEEREIRKKLQQYQPKEAENIGKGGMANWVRKQVSNEIVESKGVFDSKTGSDEISLVNITVISVTEQAGGQPNENPSILIRSGHLRLEKCDIRGENGAGIQVEGEGAELSMRNSRLLNTRGSGIWMRTRAKATLSQCQIIKCKESGVDAQGFTALRLTECEITNNLKTGIQLSFKSQLLAYHSIIAGNHFEGIWISNHSNGTIKGCDLRGNGRGPFDISPDSRVELSGNKP